MSARQKYPQCDDDEFVAPDISARLLPKERRLAENKEFFIACVDVSARCFTPFNMTMTLTDLQCLTPQRYVMLTEGKHLTVLQ